MAVAPEVEEEGEFSWYKWVLTSADPVALPTPCIGARNEKSVDVRGASDANGFNTASIEIHGTLDLHDNTNFKLLNTVPETINLAFSAASTTIYTLLPHVAQVKPVVASGTLGSTGVTIVVLVTSAMTQTH